MPLLEVKDLRKSYGGLEVVRGVSLALEAGECHGLLGPNGAGKTTTLRLCLGLAEPDAGEISLLGLPVPRAAREARIRLGVLPQLDNLDPDFTVFENLLVYGRYFGQADAVTRGRIPELLEFAGLTNRANSKIQTLSGGMKRRLSLARALINDPDLIFLDEPTTGLDPIGVYNIQQLMLRLQGQGKTTLMVTHDMQTAFAVSDRFSFIHQAELVLDGTREELEDSQNNAILQFFSPGEESLFSYTETEANDETE